MTGQSDTPHRAENCRWTRIGYAIRRAPEQERTGVLWMCVRPPDPQRLVTDQTCAGCEFWEAFDEPGRYLW